MDKAAIVTQIITTNTNSPVGVSMQKAAQKVLLKNK